MSGQRSKADSLLERAQKSTNEIERLHAGVLFADLLMPAHIDSAYTFLSKAHLLGTLNDGVEKADYLNTLAVYLWYKGKRDSAVQTLYPIVRMQETDELLSQLARANNNIGTLYSRQQKFDSAVKYLNESLRIDLARQNESGVSKTYYDLSVINFRQGRYSLALQHQLQSIAYLEEAKDTMRLIHGLNVLGNIYLNLNETEKALQSYEKAIELDTKFEGTETLAILYNNLASLFSRDPEHFEKAIEYAYIGISHAERTNNTEIQRTLNSNIGAAFLTAGEPEKALEKYHSSIKDIDSGELVRELDGIYIGMANAHMQLGNYDSVRYYAKKGHEIAKSINALVLKSSALFLLAGADSAMNDYRSAFNHYRQAVALRDSTWNIENRNRISELQIIHDTEKKEAENILLSDQNIFNKRIIRSQKLLIILSVSILAMMAVILIREHWSKKKMFKQHKEIISQQEEINQKNAALSELNSTKDKFFSIISHDLQGPFSSLVSLLEVLSEEYDQMDDIEKRKIIKLLHQNSSNTHNLLMNLLEWSRTQTGSLENKPTKVDLHEITEKVFNFLETRAKQKKQNLVNEVPDFIFAWADPRLVQSIVINLVNNAIKFSDTGGLIRVRAEKKNGILQICVIDNGIGIPEDKIDNLFRLDSNFRRPGTNKELGTGLGLILVKEFLELSKGTINVESKPNEGSTFCFTLPLFES